MDLRDELDQLAGRPAAPTTAQLDADLARGRGALTRRRVLQAGGGSLFAIAAAVAVVSLTSTAAAPTDPGVTAIGDRPPATATKDGVKLVAYKGEQPKGFTIDTVPDGWFVQAVSEYALVIAPDKARNPGPGVDPSKSPVYDPSDYRDKIAIYLESKDAGVPEGRAIKAGDRDGILRKDERGMDTDANGKMHLEPVRPDGDYGGRVWLKEPKGIYLTVQFWEGLGFNEKQMIELAAGVHVHAGAVQGVG